MEDPAEITYKLRPATWATKRKSPVVDHLRALAAKVGANLEGAYWLEDVRVAGKADVTGFVRLTSHGIGRRRGGTTSIRTVGTDGPSPHLLTGLDVANANKASANKLSGRLANVSALTIDVGRARLSDSPELDIKADRNVTITFVRNGSVVGRATIRG